MLAGSSFISISALLAKTAALPERKARRVPPGLAAARADLFVEDVSAWLPDRCGGVRYLAPTGRSPRPILERMETRS
jgi:hypothetical protein